MILELKRKEQISSYGTNNICTRCVNLRSNSKYRLPMATRFQATRLWIDFHWFAITGKRLAACSGNLFAFLGVEGRWFGGETNGWLWYFHCRGFPCHRKLSFSNLVGEQSNHGIYVPREPEVFPNKVILGASPASTAWSQRVGNGSHPATCRHLQPENRWNSTPGLLPLKGVHGYSQPGSLRHEESSQRCGFNNVTEKPYHCSGNMPGQPRNNTWPGRNKPAEPLLLEGMCFSLRTNWVPWEFGLKRSGSQMNLLFFT